jgi:hypothetical protein
MRLLINCVCLIKVSVSQIRESQTVEHQGANEPDCCVCTT